MNNKIEITWLGHACFKINCADYTIVIDPFKDGSVPGCSNIKEVANEVLCSHEHGDHNARETVVLKDESQSPFTITIINTYHDDDKGAKRGNNKMHILSTDKIRIAHFGDLGCKLTSQQIAELGKLDALMIPVGGHYTIDAKEAKEIVNQLDVKVVIPMHYRSPDFGFDVIGTLDAYTSLCDDVIYHDANTITITENMKPQTAILKYKK